MKKSRGGKAYSLDMRQCVLEALEGGMSKMQAHRSFQVSRSTIDDWLRLRRETGQVQDKPGLRRGRANAIHDLVVFEAFATRYCHATLAQMAVAWERETGQKLSLMTFSKALRRIQWTRKKSDSFTVSETPSGESNSCRTSAKFPSPNGFIWTKRESKIP
jgi:transposase